MLERVEKDVLQPSGVSFLRIDGSVDASQRFAVVQVRGLAVILHRRLICLNISVSMLSGSHCV